MLATNDSSSSLSTSTDVDQDSLNTNKKVRFIVQKQNRSLPSNSHLLISSTRDSNMAKRQNLSFVDAVNGKHLDLSTGLFSYSPFAASSSSFSSSVTLSDPHRHSHTHFSSSPSTLTSPSQPPHSSNTQTENKNLPSSSLSTNNHSSSVGAGSTTTITLKEAIDANIIDPRSAYVVDTLEQR